MGITTPLDEAAWVYSRLEQYDRQQRFDAAASLSEWGIFSLRQIAKIVGLSHSYVAKIAGSKANKTGGRFDPESLRLLLDLAEKRRRSEQLDPDDVRAALDAGTGTSPYMAARLTGIPRMHLVRRYNATKEE